jgi:hypothetical protein
MIQTSLVPFTDMEISVHPRQSAAKKAFMCYTPPVQNTVNPVVQRYRHSPVILNLSPDGYSNENTAS